MKLLIAGLFGILALVFMPVEAECQSRSPVQKPRPTFKPSSRSRPPGGTRRPLQRSRRDLVTQPNGFDFGMIIGTSHSLTDIGGTRFESRPFLFDTQWRTTSINVGAFGRYKAGKVFSVRAALNYGRISGADSLSGENSSRYQRNFYFTNNILELSFIGEAYLPRFVPTSPFDFYAFAGVAMFYHNPNLVVPNPANYEFTEFNKFQPAIPIGIGGFYTLPNNLRVGYEVGMRKTFFDYLDGFTRPASTGNDIYYFGAVKVSYFIPQYNRRIRW